MRVWWVFLQVLWKQGDVVLKWGAIFDSLGETAHFFLTAIWINKDGAMVRLRDLGRVENLRESQQIEETECPKMILGCVYKALTLIARSRSTTCLHEFKKDFNHG